MNNIIKGIKLILSGLLLPFKSMNLFNNINNRIKDCNNIHSHRIDSINKDISFMKEQIDGLIKSVHMSKYDIIELKNENKTHINCLNGSKSSHLLYLINELQLSLESMRPKDLGTFNFISNKLTQPELDMIEAEAKGISVAREEYDYTSEKKALDKKVQKMMKLDEDEFINN